MVKFGNLRLFLMLVGACCFSALIFERPTRDEVFKHLMQDDQVRNNFIRCFTPHKDIVSSELYGNSLRPLKAHNNVLNILKMKDFEKFVDKSDRSRLKLPKGKFRKDRAFRAFKADLGLAKRFFARLRNDYENIKKILLDDKSGTCDVIAKLPNGDFVLIEVQVEEETCQDARFLAYLCTLYGIQLRVGESWNRLRSVVAVNILGKGIRDDVVMWHKSDHYKRHYQMIDRLHSGDAPRMLPQVQLIQYSLGNLPNLNEIEDPSERHWLRFFASAHFENEIPPDSPPIIRQAYDIVRPEHLPDSVKAAIVAEDKLILNMKDVFLQRGRQEGRQEGRIFFLNQLLADGTIDQDAYNRMLMKEQSEVESLNVEEAAASDPTAGSGLRFKRMRLHDQVTAVDDTPADATTASNETAATAGETVVSTADLRRHVLKATGSVKQLP